MNDEQIFKARIDGVKVVHRMTKAMEMIAASRLRQNQLQRQASQAYAETIQNMLKTPWPSLANHSALQRYLQPKLDFQCEWLVVLSGSQGFCGHLNLSLFRYVESILQQRWEVRREVQLVLLGAKAIQYFERSPWACRILMKEDLEGRWPTFKAIMEWTRQFNAHFQSGEVDSIEIVFNQFLSATRHVPTCLPFLPFPLLTPGGIESSGEVEKLEVFFDESPPHEIFEALVPRYLESSLHQHFLEHAACENAARMMAMQGACENAEKMVAGLTLESHRARQKSITQGVIEINSGAQVLMER